MYNKTVIITAGGMGKRMGNNLPKQFLALQKSPILIHTILKFYNYDNSIQLILTLPENWISYWERTCAETNFDIQHEIIAGGKERYDSIKKALTLSKGKLIAIHDGIRPLVSTETIQKAFEMAEKKGNAIPIFPIKESVRFVENEKTHSINRNNYFLVQTPQVFERGLIKSAYEQDFQESITDDASLLEKTGKKIYVFQGNEENIKITTPLDLRIAEELISNL